jgi:hypothetical protein
VTDKKKSDSGETPKSVDLSEGRKAHVINMVVSPDADAPPGGVQGAISAAAAGDASSGGGSSSGDSGKAPAKDSDS